MKVLQYHTNDAPDVQAECLRQLKEGYYDLLHIHGCWRLQAWTLARTALKHGVRLVFSPESQLEPWVMKEGYWNDKLPKELLYQRWIARKSYAVIVQGKMEEECLRRLGWNSRLVIIRNPKITNTITQQEAEQQHQQVYRKVMDSNMLELMNEDTVHMLGLFIKAGITGDKRWIDEETTTLDTEQWRQILCYAHQEQLTDVVHRGILVLRYDAPDIVASDIDYFVPDNYETPKSIESVIGSSFVSENARLLATFRQFRKLWLRRRLAIAHLVELDKELRFHPFDEEHLCEDLKEYHMLKMAARLMQLMKEYTGLTEGFMPMTPLNDRITRQMRKQINNHLAI